MNIENYLTHPTFGMLFRLCLLDNQKELFATLYAQRLFFIVSSETGVLRFEPLTRSDARTMIESRIRLLRRESNLDAFRELQTTYQTLF